MDFIDIGLNAAYILIALCLLGAIVLPLINAMSDPKGLLGGLVGLIALAVIFGLGYSFAGNEVTAVYTKAGVDASDSQLVGAMLNTTYVLIALSFIGIVFTWVHDLIK
ncbi:hypothetical protein FUAX_30420 [Fulvitalea axinellae]|uniref:MotA/TolQ/ExbB proton channel domain-containing protein n=1 Tax=Fulvitalea axinellae TaxID=1182444 RepID=A0AAU9CMM5_9BACT|nr:hypothetical protein FUAX_30420 [Fulvitalea axinellae]